MVMKRPAILTGPTGATALRKPCALRRSGTALLLLCALLGSAAAPAIESGGAAAASASGDGWQASNVEVFFSDLSTESLNAEIRIGQFVLSEPRLVLRDISIKCAQLDLSWRDLRCTDARVRIGRSPLDDGEFRASFTYQFANSATKVSASRIKAAGGSLNVALGLRPAGWEATLSAARLTPEGLHKLASNFGGVTELPQLTGEFNAELSASGGSAHGKLKARAEAISVSGSNEAGTLASDKFSASMTAEATWSGAEWNVSLSADSSSGQVYVHPLFVDFAAYPLAVEGQLTGTPATDWRLVYQVQQAGIGRADGVAEFSAAAGLAPGYLELNFPEALLPGAYLVYLQPFLVGTSADSLESVGKLSGQLRARDGALQSVGVDLNELYLDDTRNRFALYGLNGRIDWDAAATRLSHINWQGGYGYQIGFGAAALEIQTSDSSLELTGPVRIPVLDGALMVNAFAVRNAGQPDMSLDFDGDIETIGMRALTRALRWPPFSGSLSGTLPRMRYSEDGVTVDGILTARVFDGEVSVENLRLSDPLGVLPELQANVRMRRLDLEPLTRAFSFGFIEGRLDGDISNLRMLGFSPVRFDAQLYTTPRDKSRRRISQQAIENISDLGGAGAGAALSRGMLRFFESFAYDEIGWRCVLDDEVCLMNGVAPAPGGGYYIVRGKGLPRINVIGFSRRVSWPLLVKKLSEISTGTGPEIR